MAERLRSREGKYIRKSELLERWMNDGFDPSSAPAPLLTDLLETVEGVEGEYGEDHVTALEKVQRIITDYEPTRRPLTPAEKAELIVLSTRDIVGRANRTEEADQAYRYMRHEVLPSVLGASFFTKCSKELGAALRKDAIKKSEIFGDRSDEFLALTSVPPLVASQIIRRFNEYGLTSFSDSDADDQEVVYGDHKRAADYLEKGQVEVARLVSRIFGSTVKGPINSVDDIIDIYDRHEQKRRMDTVEVETGADSLRILPINELRIGHQDQGEGVRLVKQTVEMLAKMPEGQKPHVILVSNLIQGGFEHNKSKKRPTLPDELDTSAEQIEAAHHVLDLLRGSGVPVIVSLGPDDHAVAFDSALNVVREMQGIIRQGGKEDFVPYYEINKIAQDPRFWQHHKFYVETIIPLCYRMGRRLRTAEEVAQATGGEISHNEYFALYAHIVNGEELPVELGIDPEILVDMAEWKDGLCFVDDFNMHATTEGGEKNVRYEHSMAFSPETLSVNHMMPTAKLLGSLATNGYPLPDLAMTGRPQEAFYLTGMLALPGLWDTTQSLNSKQYYKSAPGDASRRSNIQRGIPGVPTIDMVEMTDDGRFRQSFISKEFMEKSESLPRIAVFEICDTQIGSVSARPDYQIMYLSYMLEVAQEMPVAIQYAGDIIHGFLYPTFPEESQSVGLVKLRSQKALVTKILETHFDTSDPIIKDLVSRVIDVIVQPGNHDKTMRPKFPGNYDDNVDYLVRDMQKIVDEPGQPSKVRNDAIKIVEGTPVPTWMGTTHLGAYTLRMAHYHMERGMRGGGGFPVADAYKRAQGIGREENADILLGAHWHNPQTAVYGKKLSIVGGPMAGQTEFEDFRGMRARVMGTVVYLGGGQPVTVEFVSAETLRKHGVKFGGFMPKRLAEEGFYDDPDFDFAKHGPYSGIDMPKSALQKKLHVLTRKASELAESTAEMDNPNLYDAQGNPIQLNDATRRAFELASR